MSAGWQDAPCRAEPDLWFPEAPGNADKRAIRGCLRCPYIAECYDRAVANGEQYGVWGGVNMHSRLIQRPIPAPRKPAEPVDKRTPSGKVLPW
jgi:hypothetical protein